MQATDALAAVLARLGDDQVEALAAACERSGKPGARLGRAVAGGSPGAHDAVKRLADAWASEPLLTGVGIALALRVGLRARSESRARRSRPVWTGPGATGEQRLTASALHELISAAEARVLMVSFAAHTLEDVAVDLEAAVARGCSVDVAFETKEDSAGGYSGPVTRPFDGIDGIRRWHWPADRRQVGAVLHAKLLVADGCRALVGSANLTHRALTVNLEVGVMINDPGVAAELEAHVRGLMDSGVLLRS